MIVSEFNALLLRSAAGIRNVGIKGKLRYEPDKDPWAVTVVFQATDEDEVPWLMSRELLMHGSHRMAVTGSGDVKLKWEPYANRVIVCLSSHEGHADIAIPYPAVSEFLKATFEAVPLGDEALAVKDDVDEFIASVLGGEGS